MLVNFRMTFKICYKIYLKMHDNRIESDHIFVDKRTRIYKVLRKYLLCQRILTADRISQSCLLARRRSESTTGNSKFVSYRIHSVTYRAGVHTRETVRESRHVKHCCGG